MAQEFAWQDGARVMFIGDSITEDPLGYAQLVPAMVTARYPDRRIEYMIRGVGGNHIGHLIDRLDRDIFDNNPNPNWIIVSIGLNDSGGERIGTPLGRFRDYYHELLLRLLGTKATLVCCTTTVDGEELENARNQTLQGYNEAIREIAFTHGAQVADINAAFHEAIRLAQSRTPAIHFTTDGVQPNNYGSYLLAFTLLRTLHFSV